MDPSNAIIIKTGWRSRKNETTLGIHIEMEKQRFISVFLSGPCERVMEKHLDELVMRVSTCGVDQPL